MKLYVYLINIILFAGCGRPYKELPKDFWEVDDEFQAPANWDSCTYANAFTIRIPNYMHEEAGEMIINQNPKKENPFSYELNNLKDEPVPIGECGTTTFTQIRDSLHQGYARISVIYIKGKKGQFANNLQNIDLQSEESTQICNQLIHNALGSGQLIKIRSKQMILTHNLNMVMDICYQRVGMIKGEGPVTVHIFVLQNTDEGILLTISYHDKYKKVYKDLFNVVETIRWLHFKPLTKDY